MFVLTKSTTRREQNFQRFVDFILISTLAMSEEQKIVCFKAGDDGVRLMMFDKFIKIFLLFQSWPYVGSYLLSFCVL